MDIQWFPGHMTKAGRRMEESVRIVDLIIELTDARAPLSGRNPDFERLARGKGRVLILNKADLADDPVTHKWVEYFKDSGILPVCMDSRARKNMGALKGAIDAAAAKKRERDRKRGILNRPVRAMVIGIPNVGKSTLINTLAGRASAKTGNRPGVTKGDQWIRMGTGIELLDTPGILRPRFEDNKAGIRLALIGTINDNILDKEELAAEGVAFIKECYSGAIFQRYGVKEDGSAYDILEGMALARGCVAKGGRTDVAKAASMFLDDFRNGRIGRFTLERPPSMR